MRLLTGTDIINFYASRADLLVLNSDGTFDNIEYSDIATGDTTSYAYATTDDGAEVRILLERSTISEGDWFPGALNEDGDLDASVTDEMAAIINADADIQSLVAVEEIQQATAAWEASTVETNRLAAHRATLITNFAARCGSQSAAARRLGMDQSTVNKLVKKAQAAR